MKKILLFFAFLSPLLGFGQTVSLGTAQKKIQGTWLAQGDSICELLITADSLTTFRFRAGGVSRCTYKLSTDPCTQILQFPAATGIYMLLGYLNHPQCCSLSALTDTTLTIIYPNGNEMVYKREDLSKH